jgi:hypothetical protein
LAGAPASSQMLRLVREEHDMIRDFLVAQQAAKKSGSIEVADTSAAGDAKAAKPAVAAARHVAAAPAAAKATARSTPTAIAAVAATGATSTAAALPPVVVAAVRTDAGALPPAPPPPPPPAHPSLVRATLAVPGHVVSMTLHAVMAIGGIPSWIGHRFGGDLESAAPLPSTSS